jgi:hypothetical protein
VNYYCDFEFNGFQGRPISLGLVREDGESLYLLYPKLFKYTKWVDENVLPHLHSTPDDVAIYLTCSSASIVSTKYPPVATFLEQFFAGDPNPHVITDWPDDIKYLTEELIVGPGKMINIPRISFEVMRVDAWPNTIPEAVQHNAYWDAVALKEKVMALRRTNNESSHGVGPS